jgi:hypothetical protein
MTMKTAQKLMIAAAAALLFLSTAKADDQALALAHYEAKALGAVRNSLKDPDGARGLRLAPLAPLIGDTTALIFVIVNAKNSFGGYTGERLYAVSFKGGHVDEIVPVRP